MYTICRSIECSAEAENHWEGPTHVVLPAQVLKRDRVDILVEDEREGNCEVENVEALCTDMIWQNLDSV